MARPKTKKKTAPKITPKAEERIVELSLQNPDFGAGRLAPLLKRKKINVSSSQIYGVLKRHGLQNRDARLARLKTKTIKKRTPQRKPPAELTSEVEDQIVDLALQNPDFGAKRLLPLLLEKGIEISSSKIYSLLKRRGLQNRKLRQAKLAKLQGKKEAPAPDTASVRATAEIEERVVEVSLQNPEYGARRLAGLLAGEGISISSSAIYTMLKRHGLQTRDLRFSRIELERVTDGDLPDEEEFSGAYAVPMAAAPEEPEPAPERTDDVTEAPLPAAVPPAAAKPSRRGRWLFYLADVCLLLLLLYLGYLGYYTFLNFRQARFQPEAIADVKPEPARRAEQAQTAVEPLQGYHKIWERNLFNISEQKEPAQETEIPVEKIALAQTDIGLKLVGTVVAHDANYSRAIVHVTKTREEDAYREGDQAGEAKIKKILRNKVIITTDKGDLLLTIDEEDFGKGKAASSQRRAPMSLTSPQPNFGETGVGAPVSPVARRSARSINLKQEDVAAALADPVQLLEELTISPFLQDDQPAGFIISNIPRGSILTRMGLRNGYVVTQLNDTEITGPDQAFEFFRTLAEGGEVSIQVRRSRGVRRRPRQINLNIE